MYLKTNPEGYALALFELSRENRVELEVHNLIIELKKLLSADSNFISVLNESTITKEKKYQFFDDVFKDINDKNILKNFLKVLVSRNAIALLPRIIERYLILSDKSLNVKYAKIYSAFEISDEKLSKIKSKLEKKYQSRIVLKHYIEPKLISGFKIEIDSQIIEKNFNNDLEQLETILLRKTRKEFNG